MPRRKGGDSPRKPTLPLAKRAKSPPKVASATASGKAKVAAKAAKAGLKRKLAPTKTRAPKPRAPKGSMSQGYLLLRAVLVRVLAKRDVPTVKIAELLGVNRSYVIKLATIPMAPRNAQEKKLLSLAQASANANAIARLGLIGLTKGVDLVTTLAGGERPKLGTLAERAAKAAAKSARTPRAPKQAPAPIKAAPAPRPAPAPAPKTAPAPARRAKTKSVPAPSNKLPSVASSAARDRARDAARAQRAARGMPVHTPTIADPRQRDIDEVAVAPKPKPVKVATPAVPRVDPTDSIDQMMAGLGVPGYDSASVTPSLPLRGDSR